VGIVKAFFKHYDIKTKEGMIDGENADGNFFTVFAG
jgi:hypothetical protein